MGNEQPKQKQFRPIQIDKMKLEIAVQKTYLYVQLYRDRRNGEIKQKEKALLELIKRPERNRDDEVMKAQSIINDLKFIKASNIVLRFCDIVKDKSVNIVASQGDPTRIEELLPYIESVIWATKPLNLSNIQEFQNLMGAYFGPSIIESIQNSYRVDNELKDCFKSLIPDPYELNDYFIKFLEKNSIDIAKFNMIGHDISKDLKRPQFGGAPYQGGPGAPTGGFGGAPGYGQPGGGGFNMPPGGGGGFNLQPGVGTGGFNQPPLGGQLNQGTGFQPYATGFNNNNNNSLNSNTGYAPPVQNFSGTIPPYGNSGYSDQSFPYAQQPAFPPNNFGQTHGLQQQPQNINNTFNAGVPPYSQNYMQQPKIHEQAQPGITGYPTLNMQGGIQQTPGTNYGQPAQNNDYDELEARINRLKNGGL